MEHFFVQIVFFPLNNFKFNSFSYMFTLCEFPVTLLLIHLNFSTEGQ